MKKQKLNSQKILDALHAREVARVSAVTKEQERHPADGDDEDDDEEDDDGEACVDRTLAEIEPEIEPETEPRQVTAIHRNNNQRPFTQDEMPLLHALRNYYRDVRGVLSPIFKQSKELLQKMIHECREMAKQLEHPASDEDRRKIVSKFADLCLPSKAPFVDITQSWRQTATSILTVIIYRAEIRRSNIVQEAPLKITWTNQRASARGEESIKIIMQTFESIEKMMDDSHAEMVHMGILIDELAPNAPKTYRIKIKN